MPRLSDSMEEGTILTWLRADGDHVLKGEELVEIETDKATMTHESPEEGVLSIVAAAGTTVAVGAPIARIDQSRAPGAATTSEAAPAAPNEALAEPEPAAQPSPPPAPAAATDGAPQATPVARRLAILHGVDLARVRGTGPRGRILRADVAARAGISAQVVQSPAASAIPSTSPTPAVRSARPAAAVLSGRGQANTRELSRLQQVIVRRMAEAKATVPEFQVQTEVSMDAAIAFREMIKDQDAGVVPSFNDIIVKASALALRAHPLANGSYTDGGFELYLRVNVGIAVAADDALAVPTIMDADTKSLGTIATEARLLAERVRRGEITPPELSGATFTVSNLGMYGMTAITPIINTPQAAILGVGTTRAVPAIEAGQLIERHVMTLTLTCDHRILYGVEAARFLSDIRTHLERPLRLAL